MSRPFQIIFAVLTFLATLLAVPGLEALPRIGIAAAMVGTVMVAAALLLRQVPVIRSWASSLKCSVRQGYGFLVRLPGFRSRLLIVCLIVTLTGIGIGLAVRETQSNVDAANTARARFRVNGGAPAGSLIWSAALNGVRGDLADKNERIGVAISHFRGGIDFDLENEDSYIRTQLRAPALRRYVAELELVVIPAAPESLQIDLVLNTGRDPTVEYLLHISVWAKAAQFVFSEDGGVSFKVFRDEPTFEVKSPYVAVTVVVDPPHYTLFVNNVRAGTTRREEFQSATVPTLQIRGGPARARLTHAAFYELAVDAAR